MLILFLYFEVPIFYALQTFKIFYAFKKTYINREGIFPMLIEHFTQNGLEMAKCNIVILLFFNRKFTIFLKLTIQYF